MVVDEYFNAFIEKLFGNDAKEEPSDSVLIEESEMQLPDWYDEKKYKQGQRFYWNNCFGLTMGLIIGLVSLFSIPSILNILTGTRRSNSALTAYRRYYSTLRHVLFWFSYDLKPGTIAWKSLYTVRKRHYQAGIAAKCKGYGTVSQRDIVLTLQGFFGFCYLKPDTFGIAQNEEGDWEAYNHFWAVIVHMLGLHDRLNMCRFSFDETRQICLIIQDRAITPCLENPPEYFEHMSRVMLEGISVIYPSIETTAFMYLTKYLANVPGYIYTEEDRMQLVQKLKILVGEKKESYEGVKSSDLMEKPIIEDLPLTKQRILYPSDYMSVETSPAYKQLPFVGKYKLATLSLLINSYRTTIGHIVLNFYFKYLIFLSTYLPFIAVWTFGIKHVFLDVFRDDIADETIPKPNSEYYKPHPPESWYKKMFSILW